jgi:predicted CXXCH cytochrome family protein
VSLQDSFFPKAKFSHAAHEGATCTSCHAALTSESSEDVLLPSIETCRSCHAGEHTEIRTPSTCVSCHDFHSETVDRPLMIRSSVPGAFFR